MQKKIIALAIGGLLSGAAFAQSNVTIYGIVDGGVTSENNGNGSHMWVQGGGQQSSTRLGFRGTENLGNGMSAMFVMEMGPNLDLGTTGNGGGPGLAPAVGAGTSVGFDRQGYVGLSSTTMGTVTIGRQYSPAFYAGLTGDAVGYGNVNSNLSVFPGLPGWATRVNNMAAYTTPTFGGFSGVLGYSSGAVVDQNNPSGPLNNDRAGRVWGLLGTYANGPLTVRLAWHDVIGATNDVKSKLTLLGASYNFGAFALHGAYGSGKTDSAAGRTADASAYSLGVNVPFGANAVALTYGARNDKMAATDADWKVWGVRFTHDLSKRTNLYAAYAKGDNKNAGAQDFYTGIGGGVAGYDPNALQFGVRHQF